MDRNREARRGAMAAVNGGLLLRRRQLRTTILRNSPEEDGALEMQQEPSRLRDRGIKKDRDRDRERSSGRSKRRRGERSMHSNREEGDDSSEESIDDGDDDEEEDASVTVRLPTIANSAQIPSSSSLIQQQNQHHVVKKSSFLANNNGKPVRPPAPSWKVAEEMIGVSIPRKARSSSLKRSQECGDVIHRQASTSPARPSPSSTTAVSPSSNASVRRKKISSGTKQHRPPKIAKSSSAASSIQEIEIEVAEVLYGMTRQAPPLVDKQENCKVDSKDTEAKSSACSPNSISQQQSNFPSSSSPMVATAPKRKRPRLKFDEERPASPSTKTVCEIPAKTEEASSPKSEKNTSASSPIENGVVSCEPGDSQQDSVPGDAQQDSAKRPGSCNQVLNSKVLTEGGEEGMKKEDVAILSSKSMETSCVHANINHEESQAAAKVENLRDEKFSIDLMAPPPLPEKSSSDKDGLLDFVSDHKSLGPEKEMLPGLDIAIGETEKASNQEGASDHAGNFLAQDFDLKKQTPKEKIPDQQLDLGKLNKDGLSFSGGSKQQQQVPKQQQKSARIEPKQEKPAPLTSMPLPVPIAGWPGGFPSFGYMGQVPSVLQAVLPMDGSLGVAKTQQQHPPHFLQPQMRPKRCATHCYIAQNIHYHQQIARMHPFWPAAAAAAVVNVAKQYNLNAVPPDSATIVDNPLQGRFPPRSLGPLQDKSAPSVAMACTGPRPKERSSATPASASNSNTFMEAAQRKQFLLPQSSQPGSSAAAPPNMIHGPAFLFPINQQPAVADRSGAPSKPTPTGNAAPSATASTSSAAAGSGAAGHSTTTMSFNYAGLSQDAQYMTILQNNAILPNSPCPFPLAAAHVGGSPPFRGTVPAQAMPFFNGPFYSSQMVPSQQQQLMQQHQQQQNHQNPSTSSGSSSSQKRNTQQQQQQQRVPGGSNSHSFPTSKQPLHLLPHQARQLESEAICEDSPSTADSSRASQAQQGIYGQNFAVPMHSPNFALISPVSTAGVSHGENKQLPGAAHQHHAMKVDLTPSQAYAMSFASFGGSAATATTPGLDFSDIVQNPAMFQNLPEVARHRYPPAVAMAAAAAVAQHQAQQLKKSHHEDGKSVVETTAANANAAAGDGKIATVTAAAKSVAQQHSLSFSRPDNDPTASHIVSNHADASTHALNLLHPPVNSTQVSNLPSTAPSNAVTNSPSTLPLPSSQSKQQYYQQMLQFQHQHSQQQQQHRMLYMQHQQHQQQPPQQQPLLQQQPLSQQQQQMLLQQRMTSRQQMMTRTGKPSSTHNTSNSSNISSTTTAARFPQGGIAGFPPSLIQGVSSGASQSPQWKTSSTNRAATPAPASTATSSSSAKTQIPQQQQHPLKQQQQQPPLNPNDHHTQISFGVSTSSNKPSISSSAAATAITAGSPQNSVSKSSAAVGGGGNSGSPQASLTSKAVQPPISVLPALPLQQQQAAAKNSPSAAVSSLKPSSPITTNNSSSNRNMTTSILGHPQITPSNSNSGKKLQPYQQQSQRQQPFQQPQLFFNNPYVQAQTSQRRQTEQPNSTTTTTTTTTSGMISLAGGASVTSDPAKAAAAAAAAASNVKGLTTQQQQQAGILQHSAQFAPTTSMAPNPFMSAAFNYVQVMSPSSVSVKPASAATVPEQKQSTATGNENVHACWKPEKR